jgi:hypothetical protein
MKIKTIAESGPLNFDRRVNEAFDDGWRLAKREAIRDASGTTFYAELVKVDEAPAPDPLEALRVVRDFCEEMPTEKCLGKCPLTPWCAMYCPQDGMAPADWVIPDEEVEA